MSADPYKQSAGPLRPNSWNRYAYVENDPITFQDPHGTFLCVGCAEFDDDDEDSPQMTHAWGGVFETGIYLGLQGLAGGPGNGGGGGSASGSQYTGNGAIGCNRVAINKIPLSGSGRIDTAIGIGFGLIPNIEAQYNYLTSFVDMLKLFGSFVIGSGGTQSFGATSTESNALLSSPLLGNAVAAFFAGTSPSTPGLTYFGFGGLISSGINPTQQFVGSFSTTSQRQANGALDITISNITGLYSLTNGLLKRQCRWLFVF